MTLFKMIKKQKSIICICFFYMAGIFQCTAYGETVDFPSVVRNITRSVVGIATYSPLRSPRVIMRGTGFVVYDGLHIITNAHVLPRDSDLKYNDRLSILIGRGRTPDRRTAEVVRIDKKHDLALLKVEGDKIPTMTLGSGGLVLEGTDIAVTGFPMGSVLGLYPVTHKGIISAVTPIVTPQPTARYLGSNIIQQSRYDVYQLDLTAFPGNSGSPLYDARSGKVEGILNSVRVKGTKENAITHPSGISFAIPVIYLHNLLRDAGLN